MRDNAKEGLKIYRFSELSKDQIEKYKDTVSSAFPEVLYQSEVVKTCWPTIESYFPQYQLFLIDAEDNLIGFLNSIPVFWEVPLSLLPDDGWDWLVKTGIEDYEEMIIPNCLGGLQIIISREHLGKGYSRMLIAEGKALMEHFGFNHFIIPIRPTLKSQYPEMAMEDYIHFKIDDKIYDPWIRTHLSSGANIIKVCSNAMNIKGDIPYWEQLMGHKIEQSGYHIVPGALNPVYMNLEENIGEYREDNVWISYS